MAEGKRPGGLTALAVLNFVFGGIGAIIMLFLLTLVGVGNAVTDGALAEGMAQGLEEVGVSRGMLIIQFVFGTAGCALLIVSGVGYLKQKRVLGRTMGSLYGIVTLLATVIGLAGGQPFELSTIINLIYPVLTLILINTTFKEDLVN